MIYLLSIIALANGYSIGADNQIPQLLEHEIQMPSQDILRKKLSDSGFLGLAKHTKLIKRIAEQEKSPIAVDLEITCALEEYKQKLNQNLAYHYNNEFVFGTIFKEHPEIIKTYQAFNKPLPQTKKNSAWDKPLKIQ